MGLSSRLPSHSRLPGCFPAVFRQFPFHELSFKNNLIDSTVYPLALINHSILGICSSEDVIPLTESFIIHSEEFNKQVLFNTHLLASFIVISVFCIIMNWLNTERVSACVEAVLYAVKWISNACASDDKMDDTIKELFEKEKRLMMELSDLSQSIKPSTPEATEEFDFSKEERDESTDEEDKKLAQLSRELKALCKKRSNLLKKKERKEAFLQFYTGCLTNLSQFTYFILHHLSDIFVCIILVLMTNASPFYLNYMIYSGYE